jgi:hypothetical protein
MDWLTALTEIVKALAWPVAVIVVFFGIRKHLIELFPFLEKMKWKDLELQFSRKVREVAEEAAASLPPPAPGADGPAALSATRSKEQRLMELATVSPRAAILEAWLGVERAAANALVRRNPGRAVGATRSQQNLRTLLGTEEILNGQQVRLFEELRELRNRATHFPDFSLTESDVRDYMRAAVQLEKLLDERAETVADRES